MKKDPMQKDLFSDLKAEIVDRLKDGSYTGTITEINRDQQQYDYTKYKIKLDTKDLTLTLSFPTRITMLEGNIPSSQHAKFLVKFGVIDPKMIMRLILNRRVSFLVHNVEKDGNTYAEIIKDSVIPLS